MAEYIERDQAREVICGWCEYAGSCLADDYYWNKCDAKRRLGDIPSADVQPVVHGRWIEVEEPFGWSMIRCASCTVCGESFVLNEDLGIEDIREGCNYCPNCGADMRGESDG